MKHYQFFILAALVSGISGGSVFQKVWVNGVCAGHEAAIRVLSSHNPITDVTSEDLICNGGIDSQPAMIQVEAGDTITTMWHRVLSGLKLSATADLISPTHKGPIMFYMAQVDNSADDVTGLNWFKIHEDGLDSDSWPAHKLIRNGGFVDVTIPHCIPNGNYILRAEFVAIHEASSYPGAQFYVECAMINVNGGGRVKPATVSFPGAYRDTDPGITYNLHKNPTSYSIPGPSVFSCSREDTQDIHELKRSTERLGNRERRMRRQTSSGGKTTAKSSDKGKSSGDKGKKPTGTWSGQMPSGTKWGKGSGSPPTGAPPNGGGMPSGGTAVTSAMPAAGSGAGSDSGPAPAAVSAAGAMPSAVDPPSGSNVTTPASAVVSGGGAGAAPSAMPASPIASSGGDGGNPAPSAVPASPSGSSGGDTGGVAPSSPSGGDTGGAAPSAAPASPSGSSGGDTGGAAPSSPSGGDTGGAAPSAAPASPSGAPSTGGNMPSTGGNTGGSPGGVTGKTGKGSKGTKGTTKPKTGSTKGKKPTNGGGKPAKTTKGGAKPAKTTKGGAKPAKTTKGAKGKKPT